jgi:single-strand DNA-binding protein
MNKAILYGNVGKDPDVKHLDGGKTVCKFSLATTSFGKEKTTTWHNIVMWDKLAEVAEKWVKKGSSLIIEGEISNRSYQNKEGQTVYTSEIIAREMHFVGKKEAEEAPKDKQVEWRGQTSLSNINDLPGVKDDDLPC